MLSKNLTRISLLLVFSIILTGFISPPNAAAESRSKKRSPQSSGELKIMPIGSEGNLRPGSLVTLSAAFTGRERFGATRRLEWKILTNSDLAVLSFPLADGFNETVQLVGLSNPSAKISRADIVVQVSLRNTPLQAVVTIPYESDAESAPAEITINPPETGFKPGSLATLTATVISDERNPQVTWSTPKNENFIVVGTPVNDGSLHQVSIGVFNTAEKVNFVTIKATVGQSSTQIQIPYKRDENQAGVEAKVRSIDLIVVSSPVPKRYVVSPTKPLIIKATAITTGPTGATETQEESHALAKNARRVSDPLVAVSGKDEKTTPPAVSWIIPDDAKPFIRRAEGEDANHAVFYYVPPEKAKESDSSESEPPKPPKFVTLLVKAGSEVRPFTVELSQPAVDISWNMISPAVAKRNFGSDVNNNFLCIEVTVGNKTGTDLLLNGIAFDVPKQVGDSPNPIYIADRRLGLYDYNLVAGTRKEFKWGFNRGTLFATMNLAAQLLTGFNPSFRSATAGKTYAQGINILNNPAIKGLESIWPSTFQAERDRLEGQSLRTGKVLKNGEVVTTVVFLPKYGILRSADASNSTALTQENVLPYLGAIVLNGRRLESGDFDLRMPF